MRLHHPLAGLLLTAATLASPPAHPQPLPAPPSPSPAQLLARQFFDRAQSLHAEGRCDLAINLYLQSLHIVPRHSTTNNAALCLDILKRYDEALEMYEELLRAYSAQLTPVEQASIVQTLRDLAPKVGNLKITANVDGRVFVDGRERARLPLVGPIHLLPGKHAVRIEKEGYRPFETTVDVQPGTLLRVNALLGLRPDVAGLRVEDATSEGASVFLDGKRVGAVTWLGVVPPGKHLVWTQRDDQGSAPVAIVAVSGQTTLQQMASSALGPTVHLEASPSKAELSIDGTALGTSSWQGRLPVGLHEVSASADGYKPAAKSLLEPPSGADEPRVHLDLEIDPNYRAPTRAPTAPPTEEPPAFLKGSHPFLGAFGGFAWSPSLHAHLDGCRSACDPAATGVLFGIRGGYRLGFGLAVELAGGYLSVRSTLSFLSGFFPGVGISYEVKPWRWLGLTARLMAGLPGAQTGQDARIAPSNPGFVMPEIGAEIALGGLRAGLGLGMGFFPSVAPEIELSATRKFTPYRAFLLWAPQLAVAYSFQ